MLTHISLGALLAIFAGGLLSFFSPCVAPLAPGYIGYLSGRSVRAEAGGETVMTAQRSSLVSALHRRLLDDLHPAWAAQRCVRACSWPIAGDGDTGRDRDGGDGRVRSTSAKERHRPAGCARGGCIWLQMRRRAWGCGAGRALARFAAADALRRASARADPGVRRRGGELARGRYGGLPVLGFAPLFLAIGFGWSASPDAARDQVARLPLYYNKWRRAAARRDTLLDRPRADLRRLGAAIAAAQ